MHLVFGGTARPYGIAPFSLLGLLPLGICLFERFARRLGWSWMLRAVGLVALIGINGLLNWDIYRIRAVVASSDGLALTGGPVPQHWSITTRVRDMSKSNLAYKTIISGGFDIAAERFAWKRGESFSPASFSNLAEPRLVLTEGQLVEVTWFTDPADSNVQRTMRLKLAR